MERGDSSRHLSLIIPNETVNNKGVVQDFDGSNCDLSPILTVTSIMNHQINRDEEQSIYEEKFRLLSQRCTAVEVENQRLLDVIFQTSRLTSQGKKRRELLKRRLSKYEDITKMRIPLYHEVNTKNQMVGKQNSTTSTAPASTTSTIIKSNGIIPTIEGKPSIPHLAPTSSSTVTKNKPKSPTKANLVSGIPSSTHVTPAVSKPSTIKKIKVEDAPSPSTKNKPVGGPKKPLNPYLWFCHSYRPILQEEHFSIHQREMTNAELTKVLSAKWKTFTPEEKNVFHKKYEADKERYDNEMRQFTAKKDWHQPQDMKPKQQEQPKVLPQSQQPKTLQNKLQVPQPSVPPPIPSSLTAKSNSTNSENSAS